MRHGLVYCCLKRVVVGVQASALETYRAEDTGRSFWEISDREKLLVSPVCRAIRDGQASRGVVGQLLHDALKALAGGTDIAERAQDRRRELVLHRQLPVHNVRSVKVMVDDVQRERLKEWEVDRRARCGRKEWIFVRDCACSIDSCERSRETRAQTDVPYTKV